MVKATTNPGERYNKFQVKKKGRVIKKVTRVIPKGSKTSVTIKGLI